MVNAGSAALSALEHQCAVGAAKAEVIFQSRADRHIARLVGAIVQVALRVLVEQINGRWAFLVVKGQHGKHRLQAAGTTQQMPGHGFSRTDHDALGVFTQRRLDGIGFIDIAQGRGGAVRIEVVDVVRIKGRVTQGAQHGAARSVHIRCRHVTGIGTHAKPC